jgi:atypical dual specificity phosphatase
LPVLTPPYISRRGGSSAIVVEMFRTRPDAVRVIPGLWIGSAAAARHASRLAREGIDCVVDLREEGADAGHWPAGVLVTHVPLVDHGAPTVEELRDTASTVYVLVCQGHEVLVHCHAGVERTPMVVCAALLLMGWSLTEAYQRVLEARPESAPTDGQLATLRALAGELSSRQDSTSTSS